jgi:RNA polymerase sigma factor (sigma-70 family)
MQNSSHDNGATDLRAECQRVVHTLTERYSWSLLSEDDLVELSLPLATAAPMVKLELLVIQAYTVALYQACRQAADEDQREVAYTDLFRYLYRVSFNRRPEIAEDVVQRALMLIYEQIERCQHPVAFLAFAMYKLKDAAKQEGFVRGNELSGVSISLEDTADQEAEVIPLFAKEQSSELLAAIRRLPDPRQQKVVMLRFFGRLSDTQIGSQLGITPNFVRVLRFRALQHLRNDQQLKDYFT